MIVVPRRLPASLRLMSPEDLAQVADIERRSYDFPWTQGVFRDCLLADYVCLVLVAEGRVLGYGILSVAAGEAHVLNLCVDPEYRHFGYGEKILNEMLARARGASVEQVFLEVRPSNKGAMALYKKKGFHQIAHRPAYYQARKGREDAAVLALKLKPYD